MRWSRVGVAASMLALTACGGAAHRPNLNPTVAGVRHLPCRETIGSQPPEPDMRVILGIVALPASPGLQRALQTARSGLRDPDARLFAKSGLVIRPGTNFRLIVPARLRRQVSIGWGNADEDHRGTTIVVDGCAGPSRARWLAYAGGFYARDPICMRLIVAADGHRRSVRIGVGKPCTRQRPAPEPTSA